MTEENKGENNFVAGEIKISAKPVLVNIVGDEGVGKTTYVHRHMTGDFLGEHTDSVEKETRTISFCVESKAFTGIVDVECVCTRAPIPESDATIVMFDVKNPETYVSAKENVRMLQENGKFVVMCGNKVDRMYREVGPNRIGRFIWSQKTPPRYYDLSAKTNYNFEKPFLYILQKVYGEDLHFVAR